MAKKKNKITVSTVSPNIAFVGAKDGKQPFAFIYNGNTMIVMPEDQSKPFFHAEAKKICRLFPLLYKAVLSK